ncbi:MAG: indolepyruvate ferredoxin oxidoreductase subunit alpha [Candidatus Pacebacteria bacterium]|nr:indolepyruvate ferredoxin oxidoreductase subunit alpha [Candidatus Paceibacterota bacterium]
MIQDLLKSNGKAILLGNEAIIRGALEAGLQFVSTYPGTPASEIGNSFYKIAKQANVYFEFSTNEKVAMEATMGASFAGLKCLVAMKNFGLNVASDSLLPFLYTGSKGPTVILAADDPQCHSSAQSEENSRGFSYLGHIPTLEPSDAQECKDFTKLAFQLSLKFKTPIMVRLTTRVAHQKMPVVLGVLPKPKAFLAKFVRNQKRFVTMPPRVLEMHQELLQKIKDIQKHAETSIVNITINQKSKIKNQKYKSKIKDGEAKNAGIITSGVAYLHTREAMDLVGMEAPILKLGFFYPLPEEKIKKFIKPLKKVLIVEELDPYLEKEVERLARIVNPKLQIFGKNVLPEVGELNPDNTAIGVAKLFGKTYNPKIIQPTKKLKHLPRFCTGWPTCPYWKLYAAVKQAAPQGTVFGGDIGCYMIAALPPHSLYDYLISMGSGVGIGHGVKKALQISSGQAQKQKVIAFIGDGTFLHAGISGLMNSVYNKSGLLLIILDNSITAMTGHQVNPSMGKDSSGEEIEPVKIENIVKALNVKNIAVIDQEENYNQLVATIKEFVNSGETSVIIARHICGLLAKRQEKAKKD